MKVSTPSQAGQTAKYAGLLLLILAAVFVPYKLLGLQTQQQNGYIQGTVRSASGAEAGVWVIAETNDLATKLIKIVVTDDQGRYVLPELPTANYSVWVQF